MPPNASNSSAARRYITRALQLLGVGIAGAMPLLLVVAAVGTNDPGLGLVGIFLFAVVVVLFHSSKPRRQPVD